MGLSAGRLRQRVDVQAPNRVDNRRGGRKVPEGEAPWKTVASDVPAEVVPLRGSEAVRNDVERSLQFWRVTTRPRDDINTSDRLLWGTIAMDVIAVAPDLVGRQLVLTCQSGATGA